MNRLLRLLTASGLAIMCIAAPLAARGEFPDLASRSATGAYLAGSEALRELRTNDAARLLGDAAAESWDNPLVLHRTFIAYAANGQMDRAADTARRVLQIDAGNPLARLLLGTEALKQRRYEAAIRSLDRMGQDSFEGITGTILRAWAQVGAGRFDDAMTSLDQVAGNGLEEFLYYHRALMAEVAGQTEVAQQYAALMVEVEPFNPDAVEAYARIFGNAGRTEEALAALVAYEAQGLSHPLIDEVKTRLANGQRPGPFAGNVQAGTARMFHAVALLFVRDGTRDLAMVLERLAQYLDPGNDLVRLVLGHQYDAAGQPELANAVYESMPQGSLLRSMATVRMAGNLDALGDLPEALRRLSNIVVLEPDNIEALAMLGDLQRKDKQFEVSAETFGRVLKVTGGQSPGDWRFYFLRGIAYERSDQFPLAEPDFLKALELNPGEPEVLNYLGYSWVDKGMHLDRALELIEQAIAAAPRDGYIIDSLGWAYYRLGRYEEAVEQLELAVRVRPNDAEINDHLGDAYWRVGRQREANFQWRIAYSVDTEGKVKERVAPKLKGGLDAAPVDEDSAPIQPVDDEDAGDMATGG